MILYLYALADGLDDVGGVAGVAGEPLVRVQLPFVIAVGGWIEQPPLLDRDMLTRQDQVVRILHARAQSLLPMRFGAAMANVAAVRRAVDALATGLREQLELVRGREQITLRVLRTHHEGALGALRASGDLGASGAMGATGATPGRDYLLGRAAREAPAEIAALLKALSPLQRATRIERGRHPKVVATVYQLIDRGSATEYLRAAETLAAAEPTLTIRTSGPSPAYAFATLDPR